MISDAEKDKDLTGTVKINPMALKREINVAKDKVLKMLKGKEVKGTDLEKIVTTSLENPELGKVIAKMVKEVGNPLSSCNNSKRINNVIVSTRQGINLWGKYY